MAPSLALSVPATTSAAPLVVGALAVGVLIIAVAVAKYIAEADEVSLHAPGGVLRARRAASHVGWG